VVVPDIVCTDRHAGQCLHHIWLEVGTVVK